MRKRAGGATRLKKLSKPRGRWKMMALLHLFDKENEVIVLTTAYVPISRISGSDAARAGVQGRQTGPTSANGVYED